MEINYIEGSVLEPVGDGHKIIAHVANNSGGWGRGFVLELSKKWPDPEALFRLNWRTNLDMSLGCCQFITVEDDIQVCNMVAQDGYYDRLKNPVPLNYLALETCLTELYEWAQEQGDSIHMPKIGAGLARGDWSKIAEIINAHCEQYKVPTYVYELA